MDADAEHQAVDIAAECLMPDIEIRSSLRKPTFGSLVDLKRIWGVSITAPARRVLP